MKAKKIKKISVKREKENKEYSKKRTLFLDKNSVCFARLNNCTLKATDVHHKKGRIGSNFLDESTWIPLCRNCHSYIEEHPLIAKQLGFSEDRLT